MQEVKFVKFVKQIQLNIVGLSHNEYDCFTNVDLQMFRQYRPNARIAKLMNDDAEFVKLLGEIRVLKSSTQTRLFAKALRTYRSTWGQMSRISTAGQTIAGQQAEKTVVSIIVSTAKKMLAKPQDKLEAGIKRSSIPRCN